MKPGIGTLAILGVAAVTAAVIGVMSVIILRAHQGAFIAQLTRSADQLSETIASTTHHDMLENRRDAVHREIVTIGRQQGIERVRLFNGTGTVMFSSDESEIGRAVDKRAEACYACHAAGRPLERLPIHARSRIYRAPDGHRVLGMIRPIANQPGCWSADCHAHSRGESVLGVLDVNLSLAEADRQIARDQRNLILLAVLAIAASSTLLWWLSRQLILRPVAMLIASTRRVAQGDLSTAVPATARHELGDLARAFNHMTSRLNEAQRQLAQADKLASVGRLAAGVAHEINNPLTGVLTYASFLEQRAEPDSETRADLAVIVRETKRCREIVRGLLDFAPADSAEAAAHRPQRGGAAGAHHRHEPTGAGARGRGTRADGRSRSGARGCEPDPAGRGEPAAERRRRDGGRRRAGGRLDPRADLRGGGAAARACDDPQRDLPEGLRSARRPRAPRWGPGDPRGPAGHGPRVRRPPGSGLRPRQPPRVGGLRRRRGRRLPVPRVPHAARGAGASLRRVRSAGVRRAGGALRPGGVVHAQGLSRQPLGGAGCDRIAGLRADRGGGRRARHHGGGDGPAVRALLHHQGRAGHGPRTGRDLGHRRRARRLDRRRERAGSRHALHPAHSLPGRRASRTRSAGRAAGPDARRTRGGGFGADRATDAGPPGRRAPGRIARRVMNGRCDILVVDDEPVVSDAIRLVLGHAGFAVTAVFDAETAIAHPALDGCRLVICDLMLPGLSGFDALKSMRRRCPELPIVMTTGYATPEQEELVLAAGATAFLPKPFDDSELLTLVRHVLSQAPAAGEERKP